VEKGRVLILPKLQIEAKIERWHCGYLVRMNYYCFRGAHE